MGENTGWIKLHRKIQENEFWFSERFTKSQAWIDLLLLANHKPATIFIRGIEIHIERGQVGYAQVTLANRWKWNDRTVVRFLNMFQKRGMIQYKTDNVSTIITISNYNSYQEYTEQNTLQNTEEIQSKIQTDNNDKNVNNAEKNIFVGDKNKKETRKQAEICENIIEYYESTLKTTIVLKNNARKAVKEMINAGFSEKFIKNVILYMYKTDDYFYNKTFDLWDVARQLPRYKADMVRIKVKREAEKEESETIKPQIHYEEVKDKSGRLVKYREV